MKCEASVTPQGSYRVELYSILVHHLQFLTAHIHLLTHLARFVFSAGKIHTNFSPDKLVHHAQHYYSCFCANGALQMFKIGPNRQTLCPSCGIMYELCTALENVT